MFYEDERDYKVDIEQRAKTSNGAGHVASSDNKGNANPLMIKGERLTHRTPSSSSLVRAQRLLSNEVFHSVPSGRQQVFTVRRRR